MTMINLPQAPEVTAKPVIVNRLWLARARDEVDMEQFPEATKGTIAAESLKMLSGKGFHFIDCIKNTVKPAAKSVGEVAPLGQATITADVKGLTPEALDFIYENNGEEMIVIWEQCSSRQKFIAGSRCGGLTMSYTNIGYTDEFIGAQLSFTGGKTAAPFYFFEGDIPKPTATPA